MLGGIFSAETSFFENEETLFETKGFLENEKFPFRIKIKPLLIPKKPLNFAPFVKELKFIINKRIWGGCFFGKAMRSISKEDFEILKTAIEKTMAC